jgi:ATP-binding cassette subfamily F protein 3
MIVVNLDGVRRHYGGHDVLTGVSWAIRRGTVTGLVGPNGAGKSTLLRILAGEDEPDGGSVYRLPGLTVARQAQEPRLDGSRTVLEEALTAAPRLKALEAELRGLEARMAEPAVYEDERRLQAAIEAHARALEAFTAAGGQAFEGRMRAALRGLGFGEGDLELPVAALSGGQKKLLALAKVLIEQPDLLLLDEPDNHLDLEGKRALEELLRAYPGTVVLISHDRYLLDVVADEIVELEEGRANAYEGGYSEYVFERNARRAQALRAFEEEEREVRRLEMAARRVMSWSSGGQNEKMVRRARNMMRRVERMPRTARPPSERRTMGLDLKAERGGDKVLDLRDVDKAFGDKVVLLGLDLALWHGERVGLVGPNGAGKSVLFRIVRGALEPDGGSVYVGPSIRVGYYAQEHETLDPGWTVAHAVRTVRPMSENEVYGFLGRFLFDHPAAQKRIGALSGGEKSRLQMARLMLAAPNLLLLDEPTNNFDIPSAETLERALGDFAGSVFVISHDRYFLDAVCTRIVELEDGRLTDYPGNYTDYVAERERRREAEARRREAEAAKRLAPPARAAGRGSRPGTGGAIGGRAR